MGNVGGIGMMGEKEGGGGGGVFHVCIKYDDWEEAGGGS